MSSHKKAVSATTTLNMTAFSGRKSSSDDENICSSVAGANDCIPITSASSRRRDDKHCAVCGDHAVGYNFGAVACESCKAFFRRNALRMAMPPCLFNGVCSIQVKTRRFCSPCRLDKCFNVGMRKSCIMDEKAKRERREKIIRNRELKEVCQTHRPILSPKNTSESGGDGAGSNIYGNEFLDYEASRRGGEYGETTCSGLETFFSVSKHCHPYVTPPVYSMTLPPSGTDHRSEVISSNNWLPRLSQQESHRQQEYNHPSENPSVSNATTNDQNMGVSDDDKMSRRSNNCWTAGNENFSNEFSPLPASLHSTLPEENYTLLSAYSSDFKTRFSRHESDEAESIETDLPNTRLTAFSDSTTVTNVEDGQIWTSEQNKFSKKECIALCPDFLESGMARLLSKDQWLLLNYLRFAYESSFRDSEADHAPESSADVTLSSLVNTSGFLVRKFIIFAKKLSDFSDLGQEGQICLLKGVVLNALFIRSASHYDVVKDVWITPKGEIPTRILKIATGLEMLYEEHTKFCRHFSDVVKKDSHLVALMQVLCLFAPDRPRLADRQSVSNIHDRYILLLKHYLEARHGFTLGRTLLASVLTNLAELQALTDNYGHIILHVDPSKVDPLILEVFNLSQDVSHKESNQNKDFDLMKNKPVEVTDPPQSVSDVEFKRSALPHHPSKARCTAEAH